MVHITITHGKSICGDEGTWLQESGSGGPEWDDKPACSGYLIWQDGKARILIDIGVGRPLYLPSTMAWGRGSFNWGAGCVGCGGLYVQSRMPTQDPRFKGDMAETAKTDHQHQCFYGKQVDGRLVGKGAK